MTYTEFFDKTASENIGACLPLLIDGTVTADELYKLDTVADRFGGKYSKKVLIATSIDRLGGAGEYLRRRAKDMGIRVVENIQELDDAELTGKIGSFWSN